MRKLNKLRAFCFLLELTLLRFFFDLGPFKRRATAVPNSIDQIKFDFSTAVVQCLKPSHATAV